MRHSVEIDRVGIVSGFFSRSEPSGGLCAHLLDRGTELTLFRCHPRFLVDGGFRQLGQRFVGLFFLLQSLLKQARGLVQAEVPRPGLQPP